MTPYPTDFPSDAISTLLSTVHTRSIDKEKFAEALWNLLGYALNRVLGEPSGGFSHMPPPSDDDAYDALMELSNNEGFEGGGTSMALRIALRWALKKALEII